MKNPFAADAGGEPRLKRNPVDLSRQNLFSTHWGRITPAFMQEVIPGQSVELSSSLAIQGMPTVFPLQTKVRVSVEYFYSRNRTVHDNFEDFIFRTKDIEQPWLRMNAERAKKMISTGSLGDFFGLATTYVQDSPIFDEKSVSSQFYMSFNAAATYTESRTESSVYNEFSMALLKGIAFISGTAVNGVLRGYSSVELDFVINSDKVIYSKPYITTATILPSVQRVFFVIHDSDNKIVLPPLAGYIGVEPLSSGSSSVRTFFQIDDSIPTKWSEWTKLALEQSDSYFLFVGSFKNTLYDSQYELNYTDYFPAVPSSSYFYPEKLSLPKILIGVLDSTDDLVIEKNPYVGFSPDIPVNALPFRHYEQICNYYFRNDKNNPYVLDGEVQYNEFIPTHSDGADDNVYDFHYKNWELDRFTSAVQSPQFGEAPLVGLTYTGSDTVKLEFQGEDEQTYTAEVGVDDDNIVTTISDFSKDIPSANLDKLRQMIQFGISINDLRVTNSFQRFLENVLRRGLRYRNQLKSHFGVSVDYPDIDVPQYIGGYSGVLEVGKVTSTAQTSDANLGDFNGSLSGLISSKHKIHCYCPEHGFIFGMVTITPIPVYTQVTNKVMLKHDPFDYFLPEFGKIGFVPLHYSEVMPLQTPADGSVHDVFGYQKANYDYMRSFDEAHGFFRTTLKDFLVQRVFAERPELVEDFTVINPDQLTDVFVAGNISDKYDIKDKFLCNFYVQCRSLVPIPINGTPSLE